MQRTKKITIANREVMVKETRPRDLWDFLAGQDDPDAPEATSQAFIKDRIGLLLTRLTDLKMEDLFDLYWSEIMELIETVKEVNQDFFGLAQALGLDGPIKTFLDSLLQDLRNLYSGFSVPATDPMPGITDGVIF